MKMDIGRKTWAIAGSNMPARATGAEPEFTSRDELWMLNPGDEQAEIAITIFHTDREPIGPYELEVEAERVRSIRFNDLIDPEAIPLCRDYGAVLESSVPIIVQFCQMDTRQAENARTSMLAFPCDS